MNKMTTENLGNGATLHSMDSDGIGKAATVRKADGLYHPEDDEMRNPGFDFCALACGIAAGVLAAAVGFGILNSHRMKLWNAEMARETALWEETCDRAYERGVCDGARLANPVQPAMMSN